GRRGDFADVPPIPCLNMEISHPIPCTRCPAGGFILRRRICGRMDCQQFTVGKYTEVWAIRQNIVDNIFIL
ncbi:TPA: hypothetical protein ACJJO0_002184, partial [Neisseria meningitidis]